ncbi:MAG TPA: Na-translocating system protein MpsC family protein [Solirubrobacterales bacterium]|nr:Na-translocating system protein MpsC family protein [Solirubrobacterales bacterium]
MAPQHPRGEALAAISSGLMHLHMRFYGRGPTKAKTHMADDLVVCLLWNGFTTVEETLIEQGEEDEVERFRRTFQRTMEEPFTEVVEVATGRAVIAYMSQVHVDPNIAVELFLLEERSGAN